MLENDPKTNFYWRKQATAYQDNKVTQNCYTWHVAIENHIWFQNPKIWISGLFFKSSPRQEICFSAHKATQNEEFLISIKGACNKLFNKNNFVSLIYLTFGQKSCDDYRQTLLPSCFFSLSAFPTPHCDHHSTVSLSFRKVGLPLPVVCIHITLEMHCNKQNTTCKLFFEHCLG